MKAHLNLVKLSVNFVRSFQPIEVREDVLSRSTKIDKLGFYIGSSEACVVITILVLQMIQSHFCL